MVIEICVVDNIKSEENNQIQKYQIFLIKI